MRELVLEGERASIKEGSGETHAEVRECGMAVDDDNTSVAADVAEGLIVRTGDNVAAIAAHETELGAGNWGERVVPIGIVGTG